MRTRKGTAVLREDDEEEEADVEADNGETLPVRSPIHRPEVRDNHARRASRGMQESEGIDYFGGFGGRSARGRSAMGTRDIPLQDL